MATLQRPAPVDPLQRPSPLAALGAPAEEALKPAFAPAAPARTFAVLELEVSESVDGKGSRARSASARRSARQPGASLRASSGRPSAARRLFASSWTAEPVAEAAAEAVPEAAEVPGREVRAVASQGSAARAPADGPVDTAKVQLGSVLGIGVWRTIELQPDHLRFPNVSIPFSSILKVERQGAQICITHIGGATMSKADLKFTMDSEAAATSWDAAIAASTSKLREASRIWSSQCCPSGHEIKARRAPDEKSSLTCQLCEHKFVRRQHLMFCETCDANFCGKCRSLFHGRWLTDKGVQVELLGDHAYFADGNRVRVKAKEAGLSLLQPGRDVRKGFLADSKENKGHSNDSLEGLSRFNEFQCEQVRMNQPKEKFLLSFPAVRGWSRADFMPEMLWRRPSDVEEAAWTNSPKDLITPSAVTMPARPSDAE